MAKKGDLGTSVGSSPMANQPQGTSPSITNCLLMRVPSLGLDDVKGLMGQAISDLATTFDFDLSSQYLDSTSSLTFKFPTFEAFDFLGKVARLMRMSTPPFH